MVRRDKGGSTCSARPPQELGKALT